PGSPARRAIVADRAAPARVRPLSLHDALPIWQRRPSPLDEEPSCGRGCAVSRQRRHRPQLLAVDAQPFAARDEHPKRAAYRDEVDRKSTRLNSSHVKSSYAVFCLKKKTVAMIE